MMTRSRKIIPQWASCLLVAVMVYASGWRTSEAALSSDLPSLASMLKSVTPAVVNIATYTIVQVRNPLERYYGQFYSLPRTRRTRSAGSGVIVDAENGYIMTNNHVVEGVSEITVKLTDGRTFDAQLLGRDAQSDLALLKIDAQNLSEISLYGAADPEIGDYVVAIGNPFGLGQTVTAGIVSALGRTGLGVEGYEDFIQTDASINPGNSGGALVNLRGELVGINTAILTPSGANIGIGFAIPGHIVRVVLEQLQRYGEVRRGHLGANIQALNSELAEALNVTIAQGVVVASVDPGSAVDEAGVKPSDLVLRLGRRKITNPVDFYSQSSVLMVGDEIEIEYLRNGERYVAQLKIAANSFEKVPGERLFRGFEGAMLQNHRAPGDADTPAGVLVVEVILNSPAWQQGLRSRDILVAANDRPLRNISDLTEMAKDKSILRLRVFRDGKFGRLTLRNPRSRRLR